MLFNSYTFIFLFLPVVFFGFFWLARDSHRLAALWLAAASLVFYGWWHPQFVLLLLASFAFNYAMGYAIGHARDANAGGTRAKSILFGAIACNLILLGYFKYTNFFISTANSLGRTSWPLADIILPLGISFFTFTQIAFLIDAYRGIAREYDALHYLLFVSYFPHLIAGPVLHHKQVMPQFADPATYKFDINNVNIGLTIFAIGLFKKVALADQFAALRESRFRRCSNRGRAEATRSVDRPACLHASALLRLLGLFGHGDRPVSHVQRRAAAELRLHPTRPPVSSTSGGVGT